MIVHNWKEIMTGQDSTIRKEKGPHDTDGCGLIPEHLTCEIEIVSIDGNQFYRGPKAAMDQIPITRVSGKAGRLKYRVGQKYSIQPGVGMKSVGIVKLLKIESGFYTWVLTVEPVAAHANGSGAES